jgi:hypothetical protein
VKSSVTAKVGAVRGASASGLEWRLLRRVQRLGSSHRPPGDSRWAGQLPTASRAGHRPARTPVIGSCLGGLGVSRIAARRREAYTRQRTAASWRGGAKHALSNAVTTIIGVQFGNLLAGTIVVETVFSRQEDGSAGRHVGELVAY